MLEKRLFQGEKALQKLVIPLYESAFPINERPPVKYFFASLKKKENNLYLYFDKEEFIGFAYLTFYQDVCYLFFLAVSLSKRHQGYGGQILEDIKKVYKDYVIMLCYEEVDPKYPNYLERKNREHFYLSHGFKDNKMKTNEFGVIYQTVFIGNHQIDFLTYREIFRLGFGQKALKYLSLDYSTI